MRLTSIGLVLVLCLAGAASLACERDRDIIPYRPEPASYRLDLQYDDARQAFIGMVHNTGGRPLTDVRIQVVFSNGLIVGPTRPVDIAEGRASTVSLPSRPPVGEWHAQVDHGVGHVIVLVGRQ